MQALERVRYALVAQLDRVTDYESVGRGFESLPAYQKGRYPFGYLLFCIYGGRDSKDSIQVDSGNLADAGWTASEPYNFATRNWTSPFQRKSIAFYHILQYTVSITTKEEAYG